MTNYQANKTVEMRYALSVEGIRSLASEFCATEACIRKILRLRSDSPLARLVLKRAKEIGAVKTRITTEIVHDYEN